MGGMAAVTGERRHQRAAESTGGGGAPETEPLPCPRCESTNTKFCYYNNYNLSQPRYFCKSCRRYWTQGGTLRNIPVGGGSRRNAKRSRTCSASEEMMKPAINNTGSASSCTSSALTFNGKADSEVLFNGSFTSLLNSQGGCGSSSSCGYASGFWGFSGGHELGLGLGLEEMGLLGQKRGVWPWMEFGGQLGSCGVVDGTFVDGVDCVSWPELAISAPTEGALN